MDARLDSPALSSALPPVRVSVLIVDGGGRKLAGAVAMSDLFATFRYSPRSRMLTGAPEVTGRSDCRPVYVNPPWFRSRAPCSAARWPERLPATFAPATTRRGNGVLSPCCS